jgi:hypothetical protein
MKKLYLILIPFILTSCASSPKLGDRSIEKDETLSTLNDKSQPDWADELKPFYINGQNVYSVGVTTMYGNERPEAGMRVAENNSRSNFAKTIQDKLEFYFQNAEENGGMEGTQSHFLGSEVSKLTTHSMRIESYWYKRYASTQEDGRHIYYKIYALVSMPLKDVQAAMDEALSGKVNEHKLSEDFKAKADAHLSQIMDIPTQKPTEVAKTN